MSLTKRPQRAVDFKQAGKGGASGEFRNRLRHLGGRERRLTGKNMTFKRLAARKAPYYLTVRGPLMDATTSNLIGECAEERVAVIEKGLVPRLVDGPLCIDDEAVEIE
ncbi:MAG: hypothetical protein GY953_35745 [bacterium]|nr:hypothetical protein [bacterium]